MGAQAGGNVPSTIPTPAVQFDSQGRPLNPGGSIAQNQLAAPAPARPSLARPVKQHSMASPTQSLAQAGFQPIGGNVYNQASQGLTGAMQATAGSAFQPMQTGPQTVAGSNLNQYMNPYTSQVIGNLARDTGRAMEMGSNQLGTAATRAGAFGGSRHGIAQGQMMGDALRGFQNQAGQLRQQGFMNAQQMAQQDVQNRLAANQQRLGAANQLANLGMQGFNMGQQMSNQSFQQGLAQQAMNQSLIDAAKQQYAGFTGAPAQSMQYTTAALGATPTPQSQSQTTSQSRGLFDYLTLGAMMPRFQ